MRTKIVKVDNFEIAIGALTLDQVEAHLAPVEEAADDKVKSLEAYKLKVFDMICTSLNNANPNDKWDLKRLTAELDLVIVNTLRDEIYAFSGLKKVPSGEAQPAAE